MFERLSYRAEFSNGRVIERKFDFSSGLTAIFGANGCGKSFSLEMIRFCLFGSGALRGTSDKYASVKAELWFTSRSQKYGIVRTLKSANMGRNNETIATGTTAVNAKVVDVLGFGLSVFDVACSANQDELNELSKMKPTERKRMVDSVVGIGALETVGKWANEEANLRAKEAAGIRSVLVEPTPPVEPKDYLHSTELSKEVDHLAALDQELQQVRGWLSRPMTEPVKPVLPLDGTGNPLHTLAMLEPIVQGARVLRKLIVDFETQLASLPTTFVSEERIASVEAQISALQAYDTAQAWLRLNPKPAHCVTVLQLWKEQWAQVDTNHQRDLLNKQIEKAKAGGSLNCSNCGHENHIMRDTIAFHEGILEKLLPYREVEQPPIDKARIDLLLARWAVFEPLAEEYAAKEAVPVAPMPDHDQAWVNKTRRENAQYEKRAEVERLLGQARERLTDRDYEAELAQRRAYDAALATYTATAEAYAEWATERDFKLQREEDLRATPAMLEQWRERLAAARVYEAAVEAHRAAKEKYDAASTRAAGLETEAEQFKRIKTALAHLRTQVKQYLLPSLAAVASKLIGEMTAMQRQFIHIDDDFNIAVDGQSVETLSGSERAVANLALRLALGQVLTAQTLPVFLADEIDASMDANRADCTSQTLRALQKRLSQIILVSHKEIEADHCFELV